MAELLEYHQKVLAALQKRQEWLERSELPKLKEELRSFHAAFYSIYSLLLKKGMINEDPYKQDVKVADIEVPETSPFPETDRIAKLTIRLAQFDNQLDFLVNFYQISVDSLPIEKIKRILGLIKYIDWVRFVEDNSASPNTNAMVDMVAQSRHGADPLALNILNQALATLSWTTGTILGYLRVVAEYDREIYKMELRKKVTGVMQPAEAAQIGQVKKKFAALMAGRPFFPDLAVEVIREDYSRGGEKLQEQVLKRLAVPEAKTKIMKPKVPVKTILIEGLLIIGGAGSSLAEIAAKVAENTEILENRRENLWGKIKKLLQHMLKKEPDPVIYTVEYFDTVRGTKVKEQVNINNLKNSMEQKTHFLQSVSVRGGAAMSKLEGMEETQIVGILERAIRDVQALHKTLSALDEFFKATVAKEDREKIKGFKPELSSIKNTIINANHKRYEYSAQKEETEQFKRLGIDSGTEGEP
jgi:hypothetical protein